MATFTRKHFIATAKTLQSIENPDERARIAWQFASEYKRANPRFDINKFMKAAGVRTIARNPKKRGLRLAKKVVNRVGARNRWVEDRNKLNDYLATRKKRKVRVVKRNPRKAAWAIIGFDRYGDKHYFTGRGFSRSQKLVMTYPSKQSAEYRMRDMLDELPHTIEAISMELA